MLTFSKIFLQTKVSAVSNLYYKFKSKFFLRKSSLLSEGFHHEWSNVRSLQTVPKCYAALSNRSPFWKLWSKKCLKTTGGHPQCWAHQLPMQWRRQRQWGQQLVFLLPTTAQPKQTKATRPQSTLLCMSDGMNSISRSSRERFCKQFWLCTFIYTI